MGRVEVTVDGVDVAGLERRELDHVLLTGLQHHFDPEPGNRHAVGLVRGVEEAERAAAARGDHDRRGHEDVLAAQVRGDHLDLGAVVAAAQVVHVHVAHRDAGAEERRDGEREERPPSPAGSFHSAAASAASAASSAVSAAASAASAAWLAAASAAPPVRPAAAAARSAAPAAASAASAAASAAFAAASAPAWVPAATAPAAAPTALSAASPALAAAFSAFWAACSPLWPHASQAKASAAITAIAQRAPSFPSRIPPSPHGFGAADTAPDGCRADGALAIVGGSASRVVRGITEWPRRKPGRPPWRTRERSSMRGNPC